jgi:hypothetical protein
MASRSMADHWISPRTLSPARTDSWTGPYLRRMEYRQLDRSGLRVSTRTLGTMG